MSQNKQILAHLKTGKSITPLQAQDKFKCMRLAARIGNLRKAGHEIKTTIKVKNGKNFAVYSMEQ